MTLRGRPARKAGPPRTRWVGAVLLLCGLSLLGYLAWQYVGSNYVAQRRHDALVRELDEAWGQGQGTVGARGSEATAVVRIPRFGDDYAVPLLKGTSDQVLSSGIGHLEGTSGPGEVGNFVLAGHRVTQGEPFARLPELEPGDRVSVVTSTTTYVYELDTAGGDLTVGFDDDWVVADRPVNPTGGVGPPPGAGRRLITLTTCAELFHTDDRLVVFGHLVSSERRAGDAAATPA